MSEFGMPEEAYKFFKDKAIGHILICWDGEKHVLFSSNCQGVDTDDVAAMLADASLRLAVNTISPAHFITLLVCFLGYKMIEEGGELRKEILEGVANEEVRKRN